MFQRLTGNSSNSLSARDNLFWMSVARELKRSPGLHLEFGKRLGSTIGKERLEP